MAHDNKNLSEDSRNLLKRLSVPKSMQEKFLEVTRLTDQFSREWLNDEFRDYCQEMTAMLSRKRPSPLARGGIDLWAAGLTYALCQVNFIFDPDQSIYITPQEVTKHFGVRQSSASQKANLIRKLLKIDFMDLDWTLPSLLISNPMAWLITVNGFTIDARYAPREIQEEAFRRGFIPFIPE